MKLSEFKQALIGKEAVVFELPQGELVPPHFHVTEVGMIQKHFIDCGGTVRKESKVSFQLFTAEDYDHRLPALKLQNIIRLSEDQLGLEDAEIEVEYQGESVMKFGLETKGDHFGLVALQTDCLAKDKCGIPAPKKRISMAELGKSSCQPGSGCC